MPVNPPHPRSRSSWPNRKLLLSQFMLLIGVLLLAGSASAQGSGGVTQMSSCSGTIDECGVCDGDNSTCAGCDGVPNSGLEFDDCGVCDGTNACVGCDGVPFSGLEFDSCGICGGDGSSCAVAVPMSGRGPLVALCLTLVGLGFRQLRRVRASGGMG
jgi:hypothetical protein